jgi:DNA-binding MarR family transcriptional regulator
VLLEDGDRRMLDRFGLSTSQYGMLVLLQPGEGQRLTVLSRRLLVAKSTITRLVDQLETAGIVRRLPDDGDRRAQRVVLTEEGARIRSRIIAGHDQSLERRMAILTRTEQNELSAMLAKLREGLIADLGRDGHGSA